MRKKISIYLAFLLLLGSCEQADYKTRKVLKSINVPGTKAKVEWYYINGFTSRGPEYIEYKTGDSRGEIICKAYYLNDVRLQGGIVVIQFCVNLFKYPGAIRELKEPPGLKILFDSAIGYIRPDY